MLASTSLARQCRALAAVTSPASAVPRDDEPAETEEPVAAADDAAVMHHFVVGTADIKSDNEIIALEMDPERRSIQISPNPIAHAREIWTLSAKGTAIVAAWGTPSGRGLSLSDQGLVVQEDVEGGQGARVAVWDGMGTRVAVVHDDGAASMFGVTESALARDVYFERAGSRDVGLDVAWDPHNAQVFMTAQGSHARFYDARAPSKAVLEFAAVNGGKVRSVDVNPNRSHACLAAGDDGALRFYDMKKLGDGPVQELFGGHTHWITRARYNPFHDQLVITASTDGVVCLWRAASVSSAPLVDFDMEDEEDGHVREQKDSNQDMLVKSFAEHHESVYGLAWSAVEAWTFASLSFDGKVIVNNVPSVEKYKVGTFLRWWR